MEGVEAGDHATALLVGIERGAGGIEVGCPAGFELGYDYREAHDEFAATHGVHTGAYFSMGFMSVGIRASTPLAKRLLADARIDPLVPDAHPDLEIAERAGAGKRVLIAINHGTAPHPLAPPAGATPVAGDWQGGQIAPHGIALFRMK